jgi:hypothetical protein
MNGLGSSPEEKEKEGEGWARGAGRGFPPSIAARLDYVVTPWLASGDPR